MLATLKHGWLQFYRDEEGQELITWIIIAALGVAAVIGIWKFLMPKIKGYSKTWVVSWMKQETSVKQ